MPTIRGRHLLFALSGLAALSPTKADDAARLSAANNLFAADFYAQLRDRPGNLFFSPFGVSTAMAMVELGAAGKTKSEIDRVAHFDVPPERIAANYSMLANRTKKLLPDTILCFANSLWYQRGLDILPSYADPLQIDYDALVLSLDFNGGASNACDQINRWASDATRGRIQNLVSPESVAANTEVMLVNTVYFKGRWASTFDVENTQADLFLLSYRDHAMVPTMHQTANYRLVLADGYKTLELPYSAGLTMVIILPDAIEGLPGLEREMTEAGLTGALSALDAASWRQIEVYLPRFTAKKTLDLSRTLHAMGMPTAFAIPGANFSKMSPDPLAISRIAHAATVVVDETGTEAASGTVVQDVTFDAPASPPPPPPIIRVNHPFLFLIRGNTSGTIFFMGRIADPQRN